METGSSYKLVKGRDINVMSAATVFGSARFTVSLVLTLSDLGEQHHVRTGSRNNALNRKY